jgi:hypothetical protein
MKYILLSAVAVLMATSAHAGVKDVLSMQRNASGNFDVLCLMSQGVSNTDNVTADSILSNSVCVAPAVTPLKEGNYTTTATYCPQKLSWHGATLNLQTYGGCNVLVVLNQTTPGVYEGHIAGYNLTYRATVTANDAYTFQTVDLGTSGNFKWASAEVASVQLNPVSPMAADPTQAK